MTVLQTLTLLMAAANLLIFRILVTSYHIVKKVFFRVYFKFAAISCFTFKQKNAQDVSEGVQRESRRQLLLLLLLL